MKIRFVVVTSLLTCCLSPAPTWAAPDSTKPTATTDAAKPEDPLWASYEAQEKNLGHMANDQTTDPKVRDKAIGDILDTANKLVAKYPKEDRTWEVRLAILDIHGLQGYLAGKEPDHKATEEQYMAIVNNKEAPMEVQAEADVRITGPKLGELIHQGPPTEATWKSMDTLISGYETKYKGQAIVDRVVPQFRLMELKAMHEAGKTDELKAEVKKLMTDANPNVAEMAKDVQAELDKPAPPLDSGAPSTDSQPPMTPGTAPAPAK